MGGGEDCSSQPSPRNPRIGCLPRWVWPLSANSLLWDFPQRASSLWVSVSPASYRKPGCGDVGTRKVRQEWKTLCRLLRAVLPGVARPWLPNRAHSGPGPPSLRLSLPPGRSPSLLPLPPCPGGALAPGMLCAADSLINSRLCGRPARTGRAPVAPAPAAPLPQVSVCPRACLGERGAPLRGGVCGASSGLVRLCVCIRGYTVCAFACLCFSGSALGIRATLCGCPCRGCVCVCAWQSLLASQTVASLSLLAPRGLGLLVPALGTSWLVPREGGWGPTPCPGGPGACSLCDWRSYPATSFGALEGQEAPRVMGEGSKAALWLPFLSTAQISTQNSPAGAGKGLGGTGPERGHQLPKVTQLSHEPLGSLSLWASVPQAPRQTTQS